MANSTEIWSDEEIWSDDECQSNECDSADTSKISALLKLYTFFLLTLDSFQTLIQLSMCCLQCASYSSIFHFKASNNKTCCLLLQSIFLMGKYGTIACL